MSSTIPNRLLETEATRVRQNYQLFMIGHNIAHTPNTIIWIWLVPNPILENVPLPKKWLLSKVCFQPHTFLFGTEVDQFSVLGKQKWCKMNSGVEMQILHCNSNSSTLPDVQKITMLGILSIPTIQCHTINKKQQKVGRSHASKLGS